jgi:hypothetical protein
MLELDDPSVLTRLAAPLSSNNRANVQRVTVKYRFRKSDIGHTEIGDGGP